MLGAAGPEPEASAAPEVVAVLGLLVGLAELTELVSGLLGLIAGAATTAGGVVTAGAVATGEGGVGDAGGEGCAVAVGCAGSGSGNFSSSVRTTGAGTRWGGATVCGTGSLGLAGLA